MTDVVRVYEPQTAVVVSGSEAAAAQIITTGVASINGKSGPVTINTDDIPEGSSNRYHTDERVDDRVAALIRGAGGISATYNDGTGTLTIAPLDGAMNIKDAAYAGGAKGDGSTDDTAAFNAAFAAIEAAGGGRIYMPDGTYILNGSLVLPQVGNWTLEGAGMDRTILKYADADGITPLHRPAAYPWVSEIALRNFSMEGKWLTQQNDLGRTPILFYKCSDMTIENVGCDYARGMSIALRACDRARIINPRVRWSARDGINTSACSDVVVFNPYVAWCDDDAVAWHSEDSEAFPVRDGFVCIGGTFIDTQGVRFMGGKRFIIANNRVYRPKQHGLSASFQGFEGNTPLMGGILANNIVHDVIDRGAIDGLNSGADYVYLTSALVQGALAAAPGQPVAASGTVQALYEHFMANGPTTAQPGAYFITAWGNQLVRTLPTVAKYSDWGYGQMFTRNGWLDPAITETEIGRGNGVRLGSDTGYFRDSFFEGTIINGHENSVAIDGTGMRCDNVVFRGGSMLRFNRAALTVFTIADANQGITFEGVVMDGDPQLTHANRHASVKGGWQDQITPCAINNQNASGIIVNRCQIRNVSRIQNGAGAVHLHDNTGFCDPTALGYNSGNLGIGNLLTAGERIWYHIEGSDPTDAATFRKIKNFCVREASARPSTGKYVPGMFVKNSAMTAQRNGVKGWDRISLSSNHVDGVDWRAERPQVHPGFVSAKVFSTTRRLTVPGTVAAPDTIYFIPFYLPNAFTFAGARARTVGGGAGGTNVKFAIYQNEQSLNAAGNKPFGAPLAADNTGVPASGANTTLSIGIGATLSAGWYYYAVNSNGTPNMECVQESEFGWLMGGDATIDAFKGIGYSLAHPYANAFPTIASGQAFGVVTTATIPALGLIG
ncbi:hypothetical protein JL101_035980 (plasmid) [Skermanella rosea]|uniref:glycosyl hydrolase family 28-related protein n=1 Tax=Skermanella rosea TaxID=1817965 RepID=UPI0019323A3E|nr:glycosyl hydrolase family 28-related protein [Skermanella rosea]UEM08053.1 hypothetical protein JL101_035980 [Skermanella rosea]